MPAYFDVTVEHIEDSELILGVRIKHPEKEVFPVRKNFVLQLICDPVIQDQLFGAALLSYGSIDLIQEEDWLMDNEEELIDSVEISNVKNYPVRDLSQLSNEERTAFWKDKERIPYAQYRIIVSDKSIIAHLKKGQNWESGAYEF